MKIKKLAWWLPTVFLFITNFYLSSLSWQGVREQIGWVKNIPQKEDFKIRHILQYGPLAATTSLALTKTVHGLTPIKIFLISVAIVTADGAFEEIHQSFIPSRIPSPRDVFWDFLGALVGAGLFYLFSRYRKETTDSGLITS